MHGISISVYTRVWDQKRLVGKEAHAAERRVTPRSPVALNVAAHDPRASNYPMNLPQSALEGTGGYRHQTNALRIFPNN